jgi:large subunit ribosomal protein L21
MSYAIISVGGKQYRVREGQRLLVDRMKHDEGDTFTPSILLAGGDGDPKLSPDDVVVTARVVGHVRGPKLRIFKFKPKTGYRRTTGFRSALTQIEIESIGAQKKRAKPKAEKPAEPEAAAPETTAPDEPKAEKPKPAEPKAEKPKAAKPKAVKPKAEKPAEAEAGAAEATPAVEAPAEEPKPKAARKPRTKKTTEEGS